MSTQACASIQVLDSVAGFPSKWLSDDGAKFVDLPTDFDFGLTKNVEELTEINQLQLSGVLGFGLPWTPKNRFILRDWTDPNTFDFQATPINVIAYSGGTVLTQRYLYVRASRERDKTVECALVNDETHWAIGASRLRLNEIPYDDFAFTEANVKGNMQANHSYADGDAGIYFQLANYGNLYQSRRVTVEYMRPWYHVLGLLHKGFKAIGWRFESPLLESTIGRQWISYEIDPEFFLNLTDKKLFLARLTGYSIQQIYTNDTIGQPRVETITYDQIIDDPSASYLNGGYYGFGEFLVEASITFYSFYQVSHSVTIEIALFENIASEPTIIKSKTIEYIPNDNSTTRELLIKSDEAITLLPGNFIEIRYRGESNGRSSWTDTITSGHLKVTPVKVFPSLNDTINPGTMLRKDFFIEYCKGVLHVMRGKVDTQFDCKTVTFYPNYELDYYGDAVEGFYNDGNLITVDPLQVQRTEIVRPPDFTRARYLLIAYKTSTDILVKQLEESLQYPLHSRLVDLGDEFANETEERLNPYFEATANDWVSSWPSTTKGVPMDLPHLLDHKIEDDKISISTNIGPRILITKGWTEVVFKTQDGTNENTTWFFGNQLLVLGDSSYPWGFQLPLGKDSAGDDIEENLVFGTLDQDLYNHFWKRWAFENIKNFTVDMLVFLRTRDYSNMNLRSVYAFLVGGKRSFGSLLAINEFNACRQTSTQVVFNANATTVGQFPTEPKEEDPCDSYRYELSYTEVAGVYTFSVSTDSPGPITIQYRFFDQTTWTTGAVVSNPDRLFYVRVLDSNCGDQPKIQIPIEPCGNQPVLLFSYRLAENGDHCITATLGGIILDPIDTQALTIRVDSGTPTAYTLGTEVCAAATTDFCFGGTIDFDNDCPPIDIDQCFQVPPVVLSCADNLPDIDYTLVGLDAYQLRLVGSWVSPPATWFFQFKEIGSDDDTAKIWDTKSPINKTNFLARVVMFWCDTCEPVCSTWKTIPTPMALQASQEMAHEWNFSPMTESDWESVDEMLRKEDHKGLMKLHNDLKLSGHHYCCGRDAEAVKNWFEYGLRLFR